MRLYKIYVTSRAERMVEALEARPSVSNPPKLGHSARGQVRGRITAPTKEVRLDRSTPTILPDRGCG